MATIHEYRNMLRINKHRLDDELELQPELLDRIGAARAKALVRLEAVEDELKQIEAEAYLDARDSGAKVTADEAKYSARTSRQRNTKAQQVQVARLEFEEWDKLYEAWKARGFALKELTTLYAASYFSLEEHVSRPRPSGHRGQQEEANNLDNRAAIRRTSQEASEAPRHRERRRIE